MEARLDEGPSSAGTSVPPAGFENLPLSSDGGRKRKALEVRLDEGPSDAGLCSLSVPSTDTSFLNLLMSGISSEAEIQVLPPPPVYPLAPPPPPSVYPVLPPQPLPPVYPNVSDYQASLDALQSRPLQSFEAGPSTSQTVAAVQSPDWNLDDILNLSDEECQIIQSLLDRQ